MEEQALDVRASLQFMAKDERHKVEKPYTLEYETTDAVPHSNFELETVDNITVHDVRPYMSSLSLEKEGVMILSMESHMEYEDFFDDEKLKNVFAEELRTSLKAILGASKIFFHECLVSIDSLLHAVELFSLFVQYECLTLPLQIRKRAIDFPLSSTVSGFGQPILYAHGGTLRIVMS